MKQEYRTEAFEWDSVGRRFARNESGQQQYLQGFLDSAGREGWELVSFVTIGESSRNGVAILKREAGTG